MSYAHPMPKWAFMTDDRPGGRRGRHRHHRGSWGPSGPWGPPPRARRDRGDVRLAILLLLDEQPRHGYEIITELADRSEGRWRPSPGSVYPVLKRLSKEGLVQASQEEGRRTFTLTGAGKTLVDQQREEWGEPWTREDTDTDEAMQLWAEGKQLGAAVWQVSQFDDPAQTAAAREILAEARKKIYALLAQ
ncbi:MAG: PadR family transcriptional regulator [Candidatus Nanopelagicales bacterium]|nr:PadR family transcriptional regulator [Candidatus Nanopelagicales bacterium]